MRLAAAIAISSFALVACDTTLAFQADDAQVGGGSCAVAGCPLSSLHCDVASGACVECLASADCTGGADASESALPICDPSTHACVACLVSGDCRPGYDCVTAAKQCVPSCASGGTCAEGTCTGGLCWRCTASSGCEDGSTSICDPITHQCVGCVSDATCPSDHPRCDPATQRCVRCLRSSDCDAGEVCDPTRRLCVKS